LENLVGGEFEDIQELVARLQFVEHLLAGQILAGLVGVKREGHDRIVADDGLGVGSVPNSFL